MPLFDNAFYADSVGYTAVTAWATGASIAAGALRRPTAAAAGSERVVVCIVAGTTHATTEPTWTTTRGAKNTDNTVTWQECTGLAGVNGDITNTPSWDQYKAVTSTGTLGQLVKNNAATHYFIMSTAGTIGASQPTFNTTAGATTADNTATWTSLGAVGSFTGNQAPHARMINALATTWADVGNTIFIKSSHAATQSTNLSLGGASTLAAPQRWLCHNGGAYPPLAANLTTGATETTSAGSYVVAALGVYIEGMEFICSSVGGIHTINNGNSGNQYFKNCKFTLSGNSSGPYIKMNSAAGPSGRLVFDNVQVSFAHIGQFFDINQGTLIWMNTASAIQGTVPTALFNSEGAGCAIVDIRGVDLSAAGSGKTIVGADNYAGVYTLANCKLGASVTLAGTPTTPGSEISFINCNSGALNYNTAKYNYRGTLTTETTIVRTGGASDGATPISWKIITTANAKFEQPFECPPVALWNDDIGSPITATIEGIWGGGAVPTDGDIWVEVEYLGSSATPVSSFVSDAKATVLTTAASQTASSETWGGSTTDFRLEVTFTPQMKGFVYARVKIGAASSTFYIDPKITLS